MTYYPKASAAPSGANTSGVSASVKFPEVEERILRYWDEDGTFQASIDQRPSDLPGGPRATTDSLSYHRPPLPNPPPHYAPPPPPSPTAPPPPHPTPRAPP